MEFTAELLSNGGTTAGFVVPDEVVESLSGGRKPKVVITVEDYTWRSSVASMGGRFMLGVSNAHRAASGMAPGSTYTVRLELDTAPRVVEVPAELAAALDNTPGAREAWERWSYTKQREHAESITGAKAEATRERRIAKCLAALGF